MTPNISEFNSKQVTTSIPLWPSVLAAHCKHAVLSKATSTVCHTRSKRYCRGVHADTVFANRLALLDAQLRLLSFVSTRRNLKDWEHRLWASVETVPRILTCSSEPSQYILPYVVEHASGCVLCYLHGLSCSDLAILATPLRLLQRHEVVVAVLETCIC